MEKKNKKVYLDYAATTPVDERIIEAMLPFFSKKFGNSVSSHSFGQEAKEVLTRNREIVADAMKARPEEIIFTSSATESNNFALKGIAFANKNKGKHIIISEIEHSCILETANWLERQGFEITRLSVDKYGLINIDDLEKAIREDTILVSIIHGNNEIGTIQPIKDVGRICHEKGVYFHTDAVQSFGKIEIDVNGMNIDLLTASSHKMYGPKGAACLFIRKGIRIEPLLHGGGHEFELRSGTVNVPSVVGFAKAVEFCCDEMVEEKKRLIKLRNRLIDNVLKINNSYLNGHSEKRLPNNSNFRFSFIEGESIIAELESMGITASTGSACSSSKLEPSHVLLSIGLKPEEAHGSLRITMGRWTTTEEIDYLLEVLPKTIKRLRDISPFGKNNYE